MSSLFDSGINLYRLTIKRVRPLHRVAHWLVSRTLIPWLEARHGFQTMPDDPFWFRLELLTGRHEQETGARFREIIKPGMMVLDVGAHVGYYARMFGALVGPSGRVIALEPHPRTFGILSNNVRPLPQVTPLQVAAAESEGTAELYDYLMMSASGSLHYDHSMAELQRSQTSASDVAPRLSGEFAAEAFSVRTVPIDKLLAEQGIRSVDVVKMDIEGAELSALSGMRETIAASPALRLIMEYNPQALKAFGHDPGTALQSVMDLGFTRMQIIEKDNTLTDITNQSATIAALTGRLMAGMDVVNLLVTRSE